MSAKVQVLSAPVLPTTDAVRNPAADVTVSFEKYIQKEEGIFMTRCPYCGRDYAADVNYQFCLEDGSRLVMIDKKLSGAGESVNTLDSDKTEIPPEISVEKAPRRRFGWLFVGLPVICFFILGLVVVVITVLPRTQEAANVNEKPAGKAKPIASPTVKLLTNTRVGNHETNDIGNNNKQ